MRKENFKKLQTIIGVCLLAFGIGFNLYHAYNHYGILDIKLHPEVWAQSNCGGGNTGGGCGTGCNDTPSGGGGTCGGGDGGTPIDKCTWASPSKNTGIYQVVCDSRTSSGMAYNCASPVEVDYKANNPKGTCIRK